jgi:hypothetical protein
MSIDDPVMFSRSALNQKPAPLNTIFEVELARSEECHA